MSGSASRSGGDGMADRLIQWAVHRWDWADRLDTRLMGWCGPYRRYRNRCDVEWVRRVSAAVRGTDVR